MKFNVLKILIISIFLISSLFLLTGCRDISTKSELIRYAKRHYGASKCIEYKKGENNSFKGDEVGDKATAIFEDKEYKFIYYIESSVENSGVFGPLETKKTNFEKLYISYIKDKLIMEVLELEEKFQCSIEWNIERYGKSYDLLSIDMEEERLDKEVTILLAKYIEQVDTREYFNLNTIEVYCDGQQLGEYDFSKKKYYTIEEITIDKIKSKLCDELEERENINIIGYEDVIYIKTEIMSANDILNLNNEEIEIENIDTEKTYTTYYFRYKEQIWIGVEDFRYSGDIYLIKTN